VQELGGNTAGSWPKLASGNIPYRRQHALFVNRGWQWGQEFSFFREPNLFLEFTPSQEFQKIPEFYIPRSLLGDCLHNQLSGGEKNYIGLSVVLHIFYIIIISFVFL